MTMPFSLPDWMPWWAALALIAVFLVYLLVLLAMPFNVFGLKARLDLIEARLDEIQGELRLIAHRLPGPGRDGRAELGEDAGPVQPVARPPVIAPSIEARPAPVRPAMIPRRQEPRLD
jgi:hypothetical protein